MLAGLKNTKKTPAVATLRERGVKTDTQLGKIAGLGEKNIYKARIIADTASEPVKAALRAGTTTINKEYTKLKPAASEGLPETERSAPDLASAIGRDIEAHPRP
jgi:hypothetical protein